MKLRLLDLFSGIGGFSLGLERSGAFETVAFCEVDPFCRAVLAQHWPGVRIYDDVRLLTGDALAGDGVAVDAICGGFPCQDLSFAGRRAGLEGARSGLWSEYARLIGELRPRFVIVENVPGLLSLGMGAVLGDLAALGYDAVWDCVPASAVGAPHRRDRVFIVAYPQRDELRVEPVSVGRGCGAAVPGDDGPTQPVADTDDARRVERRRAVAVQAEQPAAQRCGEAIPDPDSIGRPRLEWPAEPWLDASWAAEPDVGRVAHGVPSRVDRLRSLGNAVLPQIPEAWGRAIARVIGPR